MTAALQRYGVTAPYKGGVTQRNTVTPCYAQRYRNASVTQRNAERDMSEEEKERELFEKSAEFRARKSDPREGFSWRPSCRDPRLMRRRCAPLHLSSKAKQRNDLTARPNTSRLTSAKLSTTGRPLGTGEDTPPKRSRAGRTRKGRSLIRLKTLAALDGRTHAARRAHSLASSLESDLGGAANVTVAERQLVQHAGVLGAVIEHNETAWLAGEEIDETALLAAVNCQRRLWRVSASSVVRVR